MVIDFFARCLDRMEVPLAADVRERMLFFLDELLRWNQRINLTAITDRTVAIEKHLVDSLTIYPLLRGDERILDLGSGGGFPCIPLKIALPGLRVTSVDAVQKKVSFQRHIARLLGFKEFSALHVRAEGLSTSEACGEGFDVILSRAFTSLPAFAAMALPCLATKGKIIAMKGAEGEKELAKSAEELAAIGVVCQEIRHLQLPSSKAKRCVLSFGRA